MRILSTAHSFFPKTHAGTETIALYTSKAFKKMGHDVAVLVPTHRAGSVQESFIEQETYAGVTVFSLRTAPKDRVELDPIGRVKNNNYLPVYRNFLSSFKPDVVHVYHFLELTGTLVEACHAESIPVVFTPTDFWSVCPTYQLFNWKDEHCTLHDYSDCMKCHLREHQHHLGLSSKKLEQYYSDLSKMYGDIPMLKGYEQSYLQRTLYVRGLFEYFDVVVPPNRFMRNLLVQSELIASDAPVIPYGAPIDKFKPIQRQPSASPKKILGFAGTIRKTKGLHVLLGALEKLGPREDLEVRLYGYPVEKLYFRELNKRIKKLKHVKYLGTYANHETNEVLKALDLLVIPSIWHENTPIVAFAALSVGTPVLVSNNGGLSEMVQDYGGGETFSSASPDDLANKIEAWLEGKAMRPAVGIPTSEDYAKALLPIYEKLLSTQKEDVRFHGKSERFDTVARDLQG